MASLPDLPRLYILREAARTTVAESPPAVPGRRTGWDGVAVTTTSADPPSPGGHPALYALVALAALAGAGVWAEQLWLALLGVLGFALTIYVRRQRDDEPGPRVVLTGQYERTALNRAIELGERFSATWPALDRLLGFADPRSALTDVLEGLAEELARRERRIEHAMLVRRRLDGLDAGSPVRRRVGEELLRTVDEIRDIDAGVAHHLGKLTTAVEACEEVARELTAAERDLDVLDEIASSRGLIDAVEYDYQGLTRSGEDLANTVRHAVDAYRELLQTYAAPNSDGE
ncbi:hypothetical protein ACWKSP_02150 [Micromonosporaceae bacterium Da 78-11]